MSTVGGPLTLGTASLLRRQIQQGRWPQGARLPADAELARQLGIGTNTLRRAVGILDAEGLVERRSGAGTVVLGSHRRTPEGVVVGLMVPRDRNYFTPLVAGVQYAVREAGGRLLLQNRRLEDTDEAAVIDRLVARGARGLVLAPGSSALTSSEFLARLESLPVPVVLAERTLDGDTIGSQSHSALSTVCTDIRRGAMAAVHHLATCGRSRIGLLSSRDTVTSEFYYQGYLQACHELGLTVPTTAVLRWRYSDERAHRREHAIRRYVAGLHGTDVDAVLCFDNLLAAPMLRCLLASGIGVPDDVAVIGFDQVGPEPPIPLTTVVPNRYEVGRMAAQGVIHQISNDTRTPTAHTLVTPELIVRSSTDTAVDR